MITSSFHLYVRSSHNIHKQAYIEYIDKHVQAHLPNKGDDGELHDLVNFYQKHNHPKLLENTRTSNEVLTLANSSQIEELQQNHFLMILLVSYNNQ